MEQPRPDAAGPGPPALRQVLRFAGVVRFRPDTHAADADTIVDVRGVHPAAQG
ncbi:hypothetical protein [Alloactinosynnema sp. L-07]|uniref:hypothetical protein n=1 Tax=Alloactinosynnema sp. L-07 TaxID=1653480 RepID=UPI00065F0269|nr:hypothetical protein [Alloactinosynnema sp. L-07]CRK61603.1 hypothetical protein [Alloactinosynnema sp. L-07]